MVTDILRERTRVAPQPEEKTSVRRRTIGMPMSVHLALKEVWRNKGRFMLISVVVALITLLVLFIAGLTEGLGQGNREYIGNLNAQLVVYQDKADLSIPASRISLSTARNLRQVPGVEAVGAIAFTNVSIPMPNGKAPVRISLAGVQPGEPGEPAVIAGRGLQSRRSSEALIDQGVALRTGLKVGDVLTLRSTLGSKEQLHDLRIVGLTASNQYSIQPSVVVPYLTWEKVRPQPLPADGAGDPEVTFNVAAVRFSSAADMASMVDRIESSVKEVRAVSLRTAYENTPGYSAQQATLNLVSGFTLLIGLLVIGGFFRIQTMQKVAQIGVLKAIGTSSATVAAASIIQVFAVNAFGVLIGMLATFGLALFLPGTVPIRFVGEAIAATLATLLIIGPLGGLASIQVLLKAEPLRALGLAS